MHSEKTAVATAVAPSDVLHPDFGLMSRLQGEAAEPNRAALKAIAIRRRTTWPRK